MQPNDVLLEDQLRRVAPEVVPASNERVRAAVKDVDTLGDATFATFGTNNVFVMQHLPWIMRVYVDGVLEVTVNRKYVAVRSWLCRCCGCWRLCGAQRSVFHTLCAVRRGTQTTAW